MTLISEIFFYNISAFGIEKLLYNELGTGVTVTPVPTREINFPEFGEVYKCLN